MDYIEQGTCLIHEATRTELQNHTSPAVRAVAEIFDFPWRVDVLALGILLKSIENPTLNDYTFRFFFELQKLMVSGTVNITFEMFQLIYKKFFAICSLQNKKTVIEAMKIILPELQIEQYP